MRRMTRSTERAPTERPPRRVRGARIGISGWRYEPWRGDCYPPGLPPQQGALANLRGVERGAMRVRDHQRGGLDLGPAPFAKTRCGVAAESRRDA